MRERGWARDRRKAMRIRGERTTLVPSYAAGLEDVVIETPDRGQSPNGRFRWNQSTHHPSITVPNPARSIRIPFANNLLVPFGTKSSASPFCAFTYPVLRLRSARCRFRSRLVVPLCVGSPRRSLFEIQLEFQSPNGTYLYLVNTLATNVCLAYNAIFYRMYTHK